MQRLSNFGAFTTAGIGGRGLKVVHNALQECSWAMEEILMVFLLRQNESRIRPRTSRTQSRFGLDAVQKLVGEENECLTRNSKRLECHYYRVTRGGRRTSGYLTPCPTLAHQSEPNLWKRLELLRKSHTEECIGSWCRRTRQKPASLESKTRSEIWEGLAARQ